MEEKKSSKFVKNLKTAVILILGIGIIVLFGWYHFNSKKQIKQLEEDLVYLKSGLKTEVRHTLEKQDSFYLALVMEPFSWAIRNELLVDNVEKINQYLVQFVKEPKVEQLLVVDETGKIIASTDKKMEGQNFAQFYPDYSLHDENLSLILKEGKANLVQPVMGFDSRIGTIFCLFSTETDSLIPSSLK